MRKAKNDSTMPTGMTAFLFSNARTALATGCVAALLLAWVMWYVAPDAWLAAWVAAVFAVNAARYPLVRGLPTEGEADPSTVAWYLAGIFVSGIVWGSAGLFFFSSGSIYHQVFLAFVLGGMVAGTVASYAAWLPAFYAFAVPALAPIASRYILEGDEVSAVMGGFLVIYGVALAVLAHNLNRILRRSETLRSALGESEERFRLIAETSPVAIFISAIEDGTVLFCNAAAGDLQHVPREELIGRQVREFYKDPADRLPLVRELEEKGEFRDRPLEIVTRDGESRWVTLSGRRIAFEGKAALLSAIVDTTDQRRAEQELRESERRYRDVVEGETTLTVRFKPDTTLTFVNTAYSVRRQIPPRELIGRKFIDFLPDDEKNELLEFLASFTIDLPVKVAEFRALQPDGTIRWRTWTHRAFFDGDGAVAEFQAVGTDITERKRAEEELRESEERFRGLFEGSIQGILVTRGLEPIFANQSYADIFGYGSPRDVVELESEHSVVAPVDQARLDGYAEARMRGEEAPSAYEFQGVRKDGTLIWLENRASVVAWHGEPVILSTVVDITERRRAEEALRASEQQLQDLMDGSLQGILVHQDHKPRFVSDAWAALHGYTVEEILDMDSIVPLIVPEDRDRLVEYKERRLAGGEAPTTYEYRAVRKDGTLVWMMNHVEVINWKGETAIQTAVIDINERKQAEEALRDSEARMHLVADTVPALIAYVDAAGRYGFVNKHHKDWFGVDVEDAIGKLSRDVLGEKFYVQVTSHVDEVLSGREVTFEGSFDYGDGRVRHYQANYVPHLGESGDVLGYYSLVHDITDRKRAEVELRVAKELADAANRAKSDFLSNMSHELRTPLNAILGFGQLLDSHPTQPLEPKQKEYVGHILEGGTHLLKLIDEVLELSKIESGVMTVSMESVALRGLFRECLALVEPLAAKHGISDVSILAGTTPAKTDVVHADYTRLTQVLLNLLSNAVKYNRPGGTVTLECAEAEDGMVRLAVTDTGFGIPKNKQAELFVPFSRLGAEGTNIEGTGIGLAFTRRLVTLMYGRMGFESTEGAGSTFWVELPRAMPPKSSK